VVAAANGTARALGTRFHVRHLPSAIEVSVAEHDVEVALEERNGEPNRVVLSAGRSIRYSADGLGPGYSVDTAQAMAWREGRMVFDHAPLAEVVAELNRYRRGRIVIADGTLASRAVSGVFHAADPDGALATIGQVLKLDSASLPPLLTVLY
jgi:transmembrane sensor